MPYNEEKTRTWNQETPNDGRTFDTEFNRIYDNFETIVDNGGLPSPRSMTQLSSDLGQVEIILLSPKAQFVQAKGGFWGEVLYKSDSEIVVRPKGGSGFDPFIGAVLNDGKFTESSDPITVKLDIPANGGHLLDDITARLSDAWYILWAYEDESASLAFGFTWMPETTTVNANPTASLTLNQVNGQNVGFLFPEKAEIVIWESSIKFETPVYDTTNGYDAVADLSVNERMTSAIILNSSLIVTDFNAGAVVYQTGNFKPLSIDLGMIAEQIETRGYKDTGYRLRTNGINSLHKFFINGDEFIYCPSSSQVRGHEVEYGNSRNRYIPPDKNGICYAGFDYFYAVGDGRVYYNIYYDTDSSYFIAQYRDLGNGATNSQESYMRLPSPHNIIRVMRNNGYGYAHIRGYII